MIESGCLFQLSITLYSTANYHITLIYQSKNRFHIILQFLIKKISRAHLIHFLFSILKFSPQITLPQPHSNQYGQPEHKQALLDRHKM